MNFLKKHAPISFYIFRLSFLPIFLEPTCFNYTTEVAVGVEKNYVCIGISMNFVLHGFFGHFVMWVTLCLSILCCLCFSLILSGRMQMKSFAMRPCSLPELTLLSRIHWGGQVGVAALLPHLMKSSNDLVSRLAFISYTNAFDLTLSFQTLC